MNDEILWIYDVSILFNKNDVLNFFPDIMNLSLIENLNRSMRFLIYYLLILYLMDIIDLKTIICGVVLWTVITLFIITNSNKKFIEKFTLNNNNNNNNVKTIERKSTIDNPVMNLSVLDYGKNINIIADLDDKNIDKNIIGKDIDSINKYNYNELSRVNLLKRNFYTMPNTKVPNEQTEFAKSLYNKGPTCKQDTLQCYKNLPDVLQVGRASCSLALK
tara:strand:- start:796 stop:1449 length:654 start_codon:yes stop_codon:yes gene_type:complete